MTGGSQAQMSALTLERVPSAPGIVASCPHGNGWDLPIPPSPIPGWHQSCSTMATAKIQVVFGKIQVFFVKIQVAFP